MASRQQGTEAPVCGAGADLYAELEVDRGCSQEELRQQYERLAAQFHPDKHPDDREAAKQRFQRISYAYEILSDPERRKAYDQGGADAVRALACRDVFDPFNFGFPGTDPFALFDRFFGRKTSLARRGLGSGLFDLHADGFFDKPFSDDFFSSLPAPTEGCTATARSVAEHTVVRDGRQTTKRVTKTQAADGTRQTLEEEWVDGEKVSSKTISGSTAPAIEESKGSDTRRD